MEKANGWNEVYRGGGEHLKRVMEQYEELGYEVKPVELTPDDSCECRSCFEANEKYYKLLVMKSDKKADII